MDWIRKLVGYMRRGGLSDNMYQRILPRCLDENMGNQKTILRLGAIVSVLYVALSLMGIIGKNLLWPYLILLVMVTFLQVIARNSSTFTGSGKVRFQYTAQAAGFIFASLLGTVFSSSDTVSVTICCLMIAYGFILTDVPWRFDLSILVWTAFYTVLELRFKSGNVKTLSTDLLNVWSFGALCILVNWLFVRRKFRQYVTQVLYEQSKDTDSLSQLLTKDALRMIMEDVMDGDNQGACLLIDLDHFKGINDTYGHLFGDEVIRYSGSVIRRQIRRVDIAGRFGGDEFWIFLPGEDDKAARLVADRIRTGFLENQKELSKTPDVLTLSIGIAQREDCRTYEELFDRADKALYQAKHEGGDRICSFQEMS